jgi:hypothetical protein
MVKNGLKTRVLAVAVATGSLALGGIVAGPAVAKPSSLASVQAKLTSLRAGLARTPLPASARSRSLRAFSTAQSGLVPTQGIGIQDVICGTLGQLEETLVAIADSDGEALFAALLPTIEAVENVAGQFNCFS